MIPSFNIAPGESAEDVAMKRRLAMQMLSSGADTSPVQHWTQGAARMAQALMGGMAFNQARQDDAAERTKGNEMLAALLSGGQQPQQAQPVSTHADAIAGIESGGKYDALGPVTKTGDRAYGKYQVMGANIPSWTKAYASAEMTPEQFLASPEAQDAVFKGEFGRLAGKHGPEGAARAWFAGEGGMNDMGRKDQLGTTVQRYGQKFAQALGPQQQAGQAGGPSREALIQMLGNRYTAPMAQSIISNQIGQQFKPQDYDIHHRQDGTIIATNKKNPQDMRVMQAPGGGQSMIDFNAKRAAAEAKAKMEAERSVTQPEKDKQAKAVADIVTTDIDRAINRIDTAKGPTTGAWGSVLSNIGGTSARDVAGLLDTIKANAGFDTLAKMRAASPTGGALGSITEKELALLQATVGNLEQSQSATQLKDNLRRLKNVYLDIVHGPGNGPAREKPSYESKGAPTVDDLVKKYAR